MQCVVIETHSTFFDRHHMLMIFSERGDYKGKLHRYADGLQLSAPVYDFGRVPQRHGAVPAYNARVLFDGEVYLSNGEFMPASPAWHPTIPNFRPIPQI